MHVCVFAAHVYLLYAVFCVCVHACACLCMKVHLMPSHKIVSPVERVLFLFGCPRCICNSKIKSFSSHIPATNSNELFGWKRRVRQTVCCDSTLVPGIFIFLCGFSR